MSTDPLSLSLSDSFLISFNPCQSIFPFEMEFAVSSLPMVSPLDHAKAFCFFFKKEFADTAVALTATADYGRITKTYLREQMLKSY